MWKQLGRIAAGRGTDVSSVARAALIREIIRFVAAARPAGHARRGRMYWADTEDGHHIADPSEAATARILTGLAGPGNRVAIITPAADGAWYATAAALGDGTYEIECFTPSLRDHHRSVHASPADAAAALHTWLAARPRGTGPAPS